MLKYIFLIFKFFPENVLRKLLSGFGRQNQKDENYFPPFSFLILLIWFFSLCFLMSLAKFKTSLILLLREALLWERPLMFSLPDASNNKSSLLPVFSLVMSVGSVPAKKQIHLSDNIIG